VLHNMLHIELSTDLQLDTPAPIIVCLFEWVWMSQHLVVNPSLPNA
jgi:hypothetical protein